MVNGTSKFTKFVVSFLERKDLVNLLRTQPRERKKTIRKREREKEKERVEKRES